jgi:hypothetical protein
VRPYLGRSIITHLSMTTAEKLSAMEALWENLTRNDDAYESPAWHGDVLRKREQRVAEGKDESIDWDTAKKELCDRIVSSPEPL